MIGLTTIASPRSYSQVPESYVHAEEVLGELRRLRPQWLSSRPNTSQISVFLNGHRRLWSRVRQDPSYVPETMELMNSSMQSAVPANRDSHRDLRGAIVRAREEHREFELALAHPDFASAVDRYDSLAGC